MKQASRSAFTRQALIALVSAAIYLPSNAMADKKSDAAALNKDWETCNDASRYLFHIQDLSKASPEQRAQYESNMIADWAPQVERYTQFAAKSPAAADLARMKTLDNTAILAIWEQPEAVAAIDQMVKNTDPVQQVRGHIAQLFQAWHLADDDQARQSAVVDSLGALAKTNSKNNDLGRAAIYLITEVAPSVKIAHRLNVILAAMKSPAAVEYTKKPNHVGEPLVITGNPFKGKPFTTASWKGKVIMVDYWATWCPPCREAMPHVIDTYTKFHDQGLEIVGVSSDSVRDQLTTFLTQNPQMVWPQLFIANSEGHWHPLTKKFGIESIPTTMLIDRNGFLRDQRGGAIPEKLITEVLSEPASSNSATSGKGEKPAHASAN